MRNATSLIMLAALAGGCEREPTAQSGNAVISDIKGADPRDIEAVPTDETAVPGYGQAPVQEADTRRPEERGDGDDMVEIIDDTASNRSDQ